MYSTAVIVQPLITICFNNPSYTFVALTISKPIADKSFNVDDASVIVIGVIVFDKCSVCFSLKSTAANVFSIVDSVTDRHAKSIHHTVLSAVITISLSTYAFDEQEMIYFTKDFR